MSINSRTPLSHCFLPKYDNNWERFNKKWKFFGVEDGNKSWCQGERLQQELMIGDGMFFGVGCVSAIWHWHGRLTSLTTGHVPIKKRWHTKIHGPQNCKEQTDKMCNKLHHHRSTWHGSMTVSIVLQPTARKCEKFSSWYESYQNDGVDKMGYVHTWWHVWQSHMVQKFTILV